MTEPEESVRKKDEIGFDGFFSLESWRLIQRAVFDYFDTNGDRIKLIGFSIGVTGLFLSLGSTDQDLRRIQAFFLTITIALIVWFILNSLFTLYKNTRGRIYNHVVMAVVYACAILIFSFLSYLKSNFSNELQFYFHWVFIPIIALAINFAFVIYFKFVSRFKSISGTQLRNFFFFTLDLNLFWLYISSKFSISVMFQKMFAPTANNLSLLALLILATLLDFYPFTEQKKPRELFIDLLILAVLFAGLTSVLGFDVYNLWISLKNLINTLSHRV